MSRYVDLDGKTWDGTPISSKIQEVKTKYGYMQGITVGWLWGDNVPHIDLEEHDRQIRAEVVEECNKKLDELERKYKSCYGSEIIEMYADTYDEFRVWLKGQNK